MGQLTNLTTSDGHKLAAYVAGDPNSKRGLVVIQEIFGVNHHIRAVCDRYADQGFLTIAPALFDRAEANIELNYDETGMTKGIGLVGQIAVNDTLKDIDAAFRFLGDRKKGIIGFCWGGTLAWLAAAQIDQCDAAVGFYGGGIAANKDLKLKRPIQLHFGADDPYIPLTDITAIREAHPNLDVFSYEGAGHGFCCDERGSFNAPSCALATDRTLGFLRSHLG